MTCKPGLDLQPVTRFLGDTHWLATGIAIVVMGIVGAFAGPAGAWAVAAVGLCAVLLGNAVAIARHQHA